MRVNHTMGNSSNGPLRVNYRRFAAWAALALLVLTSCQSQEPDAEPVPSDPAPAAETATPENTVEAATATPIPTSTPEPTPTFDITTVEDWGTGQLLFDIEERDFGKTTSLGIFAIDISSGELRELSPAGTKLLDTSPDHKQILAARESVLLVLDLDSGLEQILTEDYFYLSPSGAKWDQSSNLIYYLAGDETENHLVQLNPGTGAAERLAVSSPISVLEADQGVLIWGMGSCNPFGDCTYTNLVWADESGSEIHSAPVGESGMLPCQRPTDHTFSTKNENDALSLHVLAHDQSREAVFWSLNTEYSDCAWSPDGNRLAVTLIDRSWYSGSIQNYYFQVMVPATNEIFDLSYLKAPLDSVGWSPDGVYTVFTGTELVEDTYQLHINLVELASFTITRFSQLDQFSSVNYRAVHNLAWAP